MQLNKEQMQLMKELEIRLHFALQTVEALNKNIHSDDGTRVSCPCRSSKWQRRIYR